MNDKTELPIYWGNKRWYDDGDRIVSHGEIHPHESEYIDYSCISGTSTELYSDSHRDCKFRKRLHAQIINEVVTDLPKYTEDVPGCVLTHGGIASGKTSAIELFLKIIEEPGKEYLRIDFDLIKRKLPEFQFMHSAGIKSAAGYVQSESSRLAAKAFKKAIKARVNVIYEGSLHNPETIQQRIREMRKLGYAVVIVSTYVPEPIGQERARTRFEVGGRYVPSEVVSETYKNCPKSLVTLKPLVDLLYLIDNREDLAQMVLEYKLGKVRVLNRLLYERYLHEVGPEGHLD